MHQRNGEFHTTYPLVVGKVVVIHALPFPLTYSSLTLSVFSSRSINAGFLFLCNLLLNVPILFTTLPPPH